MNRRKFFTLAAAAAVTPLLPAEAVSGSAIVTESGNLTFPLTPGGDKLYPYQIEMLRLLEATQGKMYTLRVTKNFGKVI